MRRLFGFLPILVLMAVWSGACKKNESPAAPPVPTPTPSYSTAALWLFNEGTGQAVADSSGHGMDLVLGSTGSVESIDPTWTSPGYNAVGSMLTFVTASSTYAKTASAVTLSLPGSSVTVEFLLKAPPNASTFLLFATNTIQLAGWLANTGVVMMNVGDGSNWHDVQSATTVDDNAWHYLAVTYDHSTIRLYVDGVADGVNTSSFDMPEAQLLHIGGRPSNSFLEG